MLTNNGIITKRPPYCSHTITVKVKHQSIWFNTKPNNRSKAKNEIFQTWATKYKNKSQNNYVCQNMWSTCTHLWSCVSSEQYTCINSHEWHIKLDFDHNSTVQWQHNISYNKRDNTALPQLTAYRQLDWALVSLVTT